MNECSTISRVVHHGSHEARKVPVAGKEIVLLVQRVLTRLPIEIANPLYCGGCAHFRWGLAGRVGAGGVARATRFFSTRMVNGRESSTASGTNAEHPGTFGVHSVVTKAVFSSQSPSPKGQEVQVFQDVQVCSCVFGHVSLDKSCTRRDPPGLPAAAEKASLQGMGTKLAA